MVVPEFEKSWAAFAESLDSQGGHKTDEVERSDIGHLKDVGAHSELVNVAQKRSSVGQFNIAPHEKYREFSPDWMFKNAIPIGDDGCGNYVLWMDASRIDSPILFVCHDPAEVVVLSKSPTEFFNTMRLHLSSSDGKGQHGILYDYINSWTPQTAASSGIIHTPKSNRDVFDFNAANTGDAIALDVRGKHTIVLKPSQPGVLNLGTEAEDVVAQMRRRDRNWTIGLTAAFGVVFLFFYGVLNKSILASLGHTVLALLVTGTILSTTIDSYYIWREKRRRKTQDSV